jgi:hypothetical protein
VARIRTRGLGSGWRARLGIGGVARVRSTEEWLELVRVSSIKLGLVSSTKVWF